VLAEKFAVSRLEWSIVFIFDDDEEGRENVGIPTLRDTGAIPLSSDPSPADTAQFDNGAAYMYSVNQGANMCMYDDDDAPFAENYTIGLTKFATNPTIPLDSIKMIGMIGAEGTLSLLEGHHQQA
jgi:hypothetical protein